jgi:RNAse (barnase) inhibitor barstar
MYTCPCCGYKTFENEPPGTDEICKICFWQDDGVQFGDPHYAGGANRVSLIEAQINFIDFGACEKEMLKYVRKPSQNDEKDCEWQPFDISEISRVEEIIIDLSSVKTIDDLHFVLKKELCFPEFYGMNWDAFWDAITGLVSMPKTLILKGWTNIEINFPKDSRIMRQCFDELNEEYPTFSCEVYYK